MRKLFATAKMCFREQSYFGFAELAGQYLTRILGLAALLAVWRALFMQGADMEGLTLGQMFTYTILSSALTPLFNIRTPASSWLHDGSMLGLYQRPSSIFGQLIAHTMGGWVMQLLLYALPVLALSALLGVDCRPRSWWFFPSLALAVAEGFAMDFLFACLLIRLRNLEWPVHSLREALSSLLTGAVIPFAALPWGWGEALSLTPFASLAGAPLALFCGLDSPMRLIPAQVFWTLALWPLALYCFDKSRERMVSYGG